MNLTGAMSVGMVLVLSSALLQSAANLLMRGGVRRIESFSLAPDRIIASLFSLGTEPLFMSGAVFYVVSALIWFRVISLEDLTTAYPVLIGVSFVAVSLGAVALYDEKVTLLKLVGMAAILIGVALVARSHASV